MASALNATFQLCYSDTSSENCPPCTEFSDCMRPGLYPVGTVNIKCSLSDVLIAGNGTQMGCECYGYWGFAGADN